MLSALLTALLEDLDPDFDSSENECLDNWAAKKLKLPPGLSRVACNDTIPIPQQILWSVYGEWIKALHHS